MKYDVIICYHRTAARRQEPPDKEYNTITLEELRKIIEDDPLKELILRIELFTLT